jgi:hypothetical protein
VVDECESEWEDQVRSVIRYRFLHQRCVLDTMKAVMANHVFMYFNKEYGNFCIGGSILARPAKGDASNDDFSTFYGIIPSAIFIVCLPFPIVVKSQFVDLANLFEVGQGL